jgi:hypothetical protein
MANMSQNINHKTRPEDADIAKSIVYFVMTERKLLDSGQWNANNVFRYHLSSGKVGCGDLTAADITTAFAAGCDRQHLTTSN